jgi:hypothetical protein
VRKRPDPALPLTAAAFFLGVVVATVAVLALRVDAGDVVPAGEHQVAVTQLAAEQAARDAAERQIVAQAATLQDADSLARRLVATLGDPAGVSAADLRVLRRDVARQTRTIERVRVVRVPVPGPTVTAAPAPQRPSSQPAREGPPAPAPAPAPSPPGCTISLFGTCLTR